MPQTRSQKRNAGPSTRSRGVLQPMASDRTAPSRKVSIPTPPKEAAAPTATEDTKDSCEPDVQFSKEEVHELLIARYKGKSSNSKTKQGWTRNHLEKLKACIKGLQKALEDCTEEKDNFRQMFLQSEQRCFKAEAAMKSKEQEWKEIISTLETKISNMEETGAIEATGQTSQHIAKLEETCAQQTETIKALQQRLSSAEKKLEISHLSSIETTTAYEEQRNLIADLQIRLAEANLEVTEGEALRKKLHNTIMDSKGKIRVFCRVRPLVRDEGTGIPTITFPKTTEARGRGIELFRQGKNYQFMFDKVFTPQATQEEVFEEISQFVQSVLDGSKICVFAYGQTGSGKTHTMMGTKLDKGVIPRVLDQIFDSFKKLREKGWKHDLKVSMLEIYNEKIHDLLPSNISCSTGSARRPPYIITHDSNGNTNVSDLTISTVSNSEEVMRLLEHAAQSRAVGCTRMNEQSSRSHFVMTLRISIENEIMDQHVQGVINLIDLCGTERLSTVEPTGGEKETGHINSSLGALCQVIHELKGKAEFVNYRNSKLTYLLQPCLDGRSKTLMILNLSPEPESVEHSYNSLKFGARVNTVKSQ